MGLPSVYGVCTVETVTVCVLGRLPPLPRAETKTDVSPCGVVVAWPCAEARPGGTPNPATGPEHTDKWGR
jgi:hypothetical protein